MTTLLGPLTDIQGSLRAVVANLASAGEDGAAHSATPLAW